MTTTQLTLTPAPELPEAFAAAWEALERLHRRRPVVEVLAVEQRYGRWTIAIKVDGRTHAVLGRSDLEVAARDLFTQAFGPLTTDNA